VLDCAKPINLTDKARPACLPEKNDRKKFEDNVASTEFTVSGWGDRKNELGSPDVLHAVKVPFVNQKTCQIKYEGDEEITDFMICAGNTKNGGVDSCQGDSGGPLTWQDPVSKRWKVVGVVSWGYSCADKRWPGVYAEVEDVLGWIDENTKAKCDGTNPEPTQKPEPTQEPEPTQQPEPTQEPPVGNCFSGLEDFINDGYCDDENNNADCQWDGGDCCFNTGDDWDDFCWDCECLDPDVEMPCEAEDNWTQEKCEKKQAEGKCWKNLVKKNCAKTCKYCEPCKDLRPVACERVLEKDRCDRKFAKKNCKLSCGYCQPWFPTK